MSTIKVTCADGVTFDPAEARCVGSVKRVRDRDIHKPPVIGEFPVLVEQHGNYRMFTYSKKIAELKDIQ